MTQKDLDNYLNNESICNLCKMNRSIFYAIREEAELRLKNYFYHSKEKEIKLNRPVYCSFWNRGFKILVDRVFYENGIVYVELQGNCAGCPYAAITLKEGVEKLLKTYIPQVKSVVNCKQSDA